MRSKILLIVILMSASSALFGFSDFEQPRSKEYVLYENGDSISASCRPRDGNCLIEISVAGRKFKFDESYFTQVGKLKASGLVLYESVDAEINRQSKVFIFEIDVYCKDPPTPANPYACRARAVYLDGELQVYLNRLRIN